MLPAHVSLRLGRLGVCAVAATLVVLTGVRADASIRPHRGIGPVSLGMSFGAVRAALGKPMLVNRRARIGFGREYVEYLWNYGAWIVGFERAGNSYRAVRISTTVRRHRAPGNLGVGSRVAEIVKRHPSATCRDLFPLGRWISVGGPNGRRTIFVTRSDRQPTSHPQPVSEVIVQGAVRTYGVRLSFRCGAGWQRR
jgi:hypothetical protein